MTTSNRGFFGSLLFALLLVLGFIILAWYTISLHKDTGKSDDLHAQINALQAELDASNKKLASAEADRDGFKTQVLSLENMSPKEHAARISGFPDDKLSEFYGLVPNMPNAPQINSVNLPEHGVKDADGVVALLGDYQSDLGEWRTKHSAIEGELSDLKAEHSAAEGKVSDLTAKLAAASAAVAAASANASDDSAASGQITLLSGQVSELTSERDGLLGDIDSLNTKIGSLNGQVESLTADNAALSNASDRLKSELSASAAEVTKYKAIADNAGSASVSTAAANAIGSRISTNVQNTLGDLITTSPSGSGFTLSSAAAFNPGSATLSPAGIDAIDRVSAALISEDNANPDADWTMTVMGHSDSDPISTERFPSNWELSSGRASAVIRRMVGQGVSGTRLVTAGRAEFEPIDTADTAEAKATNRRIEFSFSSEN